MRNLIYYIVLSIILIIKAQAYESCPYAAQSIVGSTTCTCSANSTQSGTIWGTDIYTDDSSICKAAVHSGAISSSGGDIQVVKLSGQNSYSGTTRNGISTYSWGSWGGSFKINKIINNSINLSNDYKIIEACLKNEQGIKNSKCQSHNIKNKDLK